MRLNYHAIRPALALASPDRRARRNRNDLKEPSLHQDLTRWDNQGGAPRWGHHFSEPLPLLPKAETALYYFNIQTDSSLAGDPEGNRYPDLQAARDVAVAMAHDMIAEGDQQDEDRRGWHV
jgi:choline dehydrogenase-like flavoprotein